MDLKVYLLLLTIAFVHGREPRGQKRDDNGSKVLKYRGETLEQLFTVYDTSFLAVVWPKITNGVHVSLSHFCWEDLTAFFKDLTEGKAWAYNVADASGRYQGGVFGGARIWLGSKQRCLALDNDFWSRDNSTRDAYETEYLSALLQRETFYGTGEEWRQLAQRDELVQRLVAAEQRPPHRLAYSVASLLLNLTRLTMVKRLVAAEQRPPHRLAYSVASLLLNLTRLAMVKVVLSEEWRQLAQRDELVQRLVAAEQRPPHRLAYSVASLLLNLTRLTMVKVVLSEEWRQLAQRDELVQRLVAAEQRPPHRLAYSVASLLLNLTRLTMVKSYDITLGLCLPRSCSARDVESLIAFSIVINDNLRSNRTVPRVARLAAVRRVDSYHLERDPGAIILLVITSLLFILSLAATVVELNVIRCRIFRPRLSRSVSFDLQRYNNSNAQKRYYDEVKKKPDGNILFKDPNPDLGKLNKIVDVNDGNNKNKSIAALPTITLDVTERAIGSCNRCGKYKKQCGSNPVQTDNMASCPRVRYSSVASLSSQEKRSNFLKKLLLCYSLRYSMKRMFNTNMANKDLAGTHLLRVVATLWVMYVHVAVIVYYVAEDAGQVNDRDSFYFILATGTLAFDTLLFVSGVFSSHHFFYLKSHYTVEELVSFGGPCGQVLQFVCFVTNRIIRLLPSYAFVILLTGVLARVTRATAALALPDGDADNCDLYWWRNVLYITNVYPAEERCMQVSWYLSAESQLHVAGALLCAAWSGARGRVAVAVAVAALLAATAADVSGAYVDPSHHWSGVLEAYGAVIERPWARVVPYFVGIFTGWMVHKANGRFSVSKVTACCLWSASISTLLTSSLIPWLALDWLTAWVHLTWPVALLWPTLVCATNYAPLARRLLDSGAIAATSRLCYSMLLLHGCVARTLLLAADSALCSSAVCMWSYFTGTATLTLLAGLLLSLLVEMPCCSLLRRLSDCATI